MIGLGFCLSVVVRGWDVVPPDSRLAPSGGAGPHVLSRHPLPKNRIKGHEIECVYVYTILFADY